LVERREHPNLYRCVAFREAIMRINADFSKRVVVKPQEHVWVASPLPGVERMMLDRIGAEKARATSLVRYAPASAFSAHVHDGGEEFLVLDGVFSDEHGDFPKGSYVRNPPTSHHTPRSAGGCTIFVKLCQFDPTDRTHVRLAADAIRFATVADRPGVAVAPLYASEDEVVRLERWDGAVSVRLPDAGGLELLVLEGSLTEGRDTLGKHGWLRLPTGAPLAARAGADGCVVWIKTGHLARVIGQDLGQVR
jgi:ChrR-like protein with cupin domain